MGVEIPGRLAHLAERPEEGGQLGLLEADIVEDPRDS